MSEFINDNGYSIQIAGITVSADAENEPENGEAVVDKITLGNWSITQNGSGELEFSDGLVTFTSAEIITAIESSAGGVA